MLVVLGAGDNKKLRRYLSYIERHLTRFDDGRQRDDGKFLATLPVSGHWMKMVRSPSIYVLFG